MADWSELFVDQVDPETLFFKEPPHTTKVFPVRFITKDGEETVTEWWNLDVPHYVYRFYVRDASAGGLASWYISRIVWTSWYISRIVWTKSFKSGQLLHNGVRVYVKHEGTPVPGAPPLPPNFLGYSLRMSWTLAAVNYP